MVSDEEKPVSHEPFGYGNRWYDRLPRRRRPATVIIGTSIGTLAGELYLWTVTGNDQLLPFMTDLLVSVTGR
jgi:hypothetical protein